MPTTLAMVEHKHGHINYGYKLIKSHTGRYNHYYFIDKHVRIPAHKVPISVRKILHGKAHTKAYNVHGHVVTHKYRYKRKAVKRKTHKTVRKIVKKKT
jgi:hypothetical protein